MKNQKNLRVFLGIMFVFACLCVHVSGQSAEDRNKIATISATGSSVRWDVAIPNAGLTITVSAPDGRVFRKEFRTGAAAEFMLSNKTERLPDGQYTYELRLTPELSQAAKEKLAAGRGKDDDSEEMRTTRLREVLPTLVQSGSFSILNGSVIVAGASEGQRPLSKVTEQQRPSVSITKNEATRSQLHHPLMIAMPDQVIPDDLIVQGSACVGLDCVNNEAFGFDTIRLKENNDRIQFDDTSTGAGFPTNNWQIRANSSANGGASFLGFVDQGATGNSETGTIVFEVDAGAPANSLTVSSTGRVGLRTATPVLDLHITTSNTPAHRLEQTSAGGFTAQTWDIAGNEANFFVRDVTGGSRLPFRIRPGAPTSSIDISASGSVGIATASPTFALDVQQNTSNNATGTVLRLKGNSAGANDNTQIRFTGKTNGDLFTIGSDITTNNGTRVFQLFDLVSSVARVTVNASGNVGIGTTAPTDLLSVNGNASKPGGGSWAVFSDERLKNIKGNFNSGLKAVMQLQPLRYEYKPANALSLNSKGEHIGFGAQALQKIIPEAVTRNDNGYLTVNNDPIIWTMLNAIKEQQKEIEQLKGQVRQLRATTRRRR
ncbi:MAG: tail fiber domain-containing protein [Pyrinomonadaceae bacterium]